MLLFLFDVRLWAFIGVIKYSLIVLKIFSIVHPITYVFHNPDLTAVWGGVGTLTEGVLWTR